MSRRPTRAANAQKRATRDARKERAAVRVGSTPADVAAERREARAAAKPSPVVVRDPKVERLWTVLLVGGAAVAFGLLGRELGDAYADRARPAMYQNDLFSALTSAAILAIVGVVAYRRWRLTRSTG